jgi:phosphatidyl-myo-inositol alpha-mannosyltransferase
VSVDTLRIGIVCPYSLTPPGGVQGQVLGLARSLRRSGHEVRVLAPCDGPPPDAGVTPLGASVPTAANGSVAPIAPDPAAQLRTIRALRDEGFDVLHLHEPLAPGPTMTTLLFSTAPIVATFHAAGDSASYKYLRPAVRRLARRIDHRCAVSPDAVALAERYLGGSYELLFNGIEVDRFADVAPHPTDGPTVFFLGRHEPRKGLDVLLAALDGLPADVRVWVGGDGPQTRELQARHAGDHRIEWLGRISDEERAARLRGADVYCSPSVRGESFGIVLLEAMAARTALVASDLDGHRNVATDGVDAVLTPVGDHRALADALARVLADADLRARIIAGGVRRAEELSMDRLAGRYLEIYRSVIAAGHRGAAMAGRAPRRP